MPINSMPMTSDLPGCSPSCSHEATIAISGIPSDDKLVVPAGSRCSTYSHVSQPMPVASTPLNTAAKMKVPVQLTGSRSKATGAIRIGINPTSICQKVNDSTSTGAQFCRRFAYTTPMAQHMPASTARVLLNIEVCICQGSSTNTSPIAASTTDSHCKPWIRSCSTGQANTSTQNGMVKTSTEVFPGPPSDSAQVLRMIKAKVWI